MASYTDNQPAFLPKETPFVDLSLYDSALQQKQTEYNKGVQRIQAGYDAVAGLDVMRGVDKQYLQSRLDETTSQLNQIAGGDFSNQSLVAQAMSIAPKVAKDPRIQTAVVSTSQIRSVQADARTKEKAGTYMPQAKYHDDKYISEYLNSTEPDASYRGDSKATNYLDYHKALQEFLDKDEPDDQQTNIPNGTYTYKSVKTSTRTAGEIKELTDAFFKLNPQYQQTINLDAEYNYRGLDTPGMYAKTVGTMQSQLDSYKQKQKTDYDNSRTHMKDPVYMKQYNEIASDTQDQINKINESISYYDGMFKSGKSLDDIKRDLQMDEVRHTYGKLYTVDNKSEEVKANEDAIHSMQFQIEGARLGIAMEERDINYIKAGIDPQTKQPLKYGDKFYPMFLAANPGYAKSLAAKAQDPTQRVTVTPTTNKDNSSLYSDKGIDKKIDEIDKSVMSAEGTLRTWYAQRHGNKGMNYADNTFINPTDEAEFKRYQAEQELAILHPETNFVVDANGNKTLKTQVDDDYLKYRDDKSMIALRKQNLITLKSDISKAADTKFSLANNKDVISIPLDNDRTAVIEVGKSQEFMNAMGDIDSKTSKHTTVVNKGTKYERTVTDDAAYQADLLANAQKYKNEKFYPALVGLIKTTSVGKANGFESARDAISKSLGKMGQDREEFKESQYKAMASRINPQGVTIDKDDFPEYRNYIQAALQNNPSGAKTLKDLNSVIPHTVYTDPTDKQAHIQYVEQDGTVGDVPVPSLTNVIGRPNESQELNDIVENSYGKITPTSGPNTLSTRNGKLKYAIAKNPLNGSWSLILLNEGAQIAIAPPTNQGMYGSALEAKKHIEDISTAINPKTKQPYTREEIIELSKN